MEKARPRRRYIILKTEDRLERPLQVLGDIGADIRCHFGIFEYSEDVPRIPYSKIDKGIVVLSTTMRGVDRIRAILALRGRLGGIRFRILKVTGTLRKAKAIADSIS